MNTNEKCELCKTNIYFSKNKYCGITCENISHILNNNVPLKIKWQTKSIIMYH